MWRTRTHHQRRTLHKSSPPSTNQPTKSLSYSPILGRRGAVALPPILEPVAHLRGRQPGGLRQLALLGRIRVRVLQVPFAQQAARALLEAVRLLFAVPDGARQRELFAHAILVDGTCVGGRR